MRASGGQALAYAAWMFLFFWLMPCLLVAVRGLPALLESANSDPTAVGSSLAGGLASIGAYGRAIYAASCRSTVTALTRLADASAARLMVAVAIRYRLGAFRSAVTLIIHVTIAGVNPPNTVTPRL